jgi:CheY-like chemotaxis protein
VKKREEHRETTASSRPSAADPHRDLAGVLHDVSNALTVLLGWVAEARSSDVSKEDSAYALGIVEQRARVARDLARQAIGATRIDEQKLLGEIINEVVMGLRVEATRASVAIQPNGVDSIAKVAGAVDVGQILTNLILNALAFAPSGTSIEIDLTCDDSRCRVVVTDHGAGVPAAIRGSIFDGESRRPGGTGVGLRHSRALARAASGDLELLAQRDGKGASFALTWPRIDIVPRAPISSAPRVRELAGIRVLLVEDDTAVTQLLETALEGRGADVTIAATRAELAKVIASGVDPFHAALVDLSPIADDVGGAIASLRTSSPGIDLILITGSADGLPEVVASGAMKLVRKPFELGEVFSALTSKKP